MKNGWQFENVDQVTVHVALSNSVTVQSYCTLKTSW